MDKYAAKIENYGAKMKNAFMRLLSERSFDDISVTDICKEAGVSRNAFYSHYDDKNHILSDAIESIVCESIGLYRNADNIPKEPAQRINAILSYIEKHKKAFAVLYADTSSGQIREELRRCYKEYLPPCLSEIFNGKWFTTQNVALACVSGLLEIIECWLRSDCAESVDSITGLIMRAHKCLYAEFANG